MLNYILADYKRVYTRIQHIVLVVLYQAVFIGFILFKHARFAGTYTSVTLVDNSTHFYATWLLVILFLADFIQSFSFDFRANTIQVALGIGISRRDVILSKLAQTALVMLTDFIITFGTFCILAAVLGLPLAGHQLNFVLCTGLGTVALAICSVALLLPLVFRTQNMLLSMVGYLFLSTGWITGWVRDLSRMGPEFIARLQLEKYCYDKCIALVQSNAIQHTFQLWPVIGAIAWFALGVYITWLAFRKMELDF
jgi:ABC-type transport system involved in multi-copper enzyme maturation permease subunit